MNKIFALTKVFLKSSFQFNYNITNDNKKENKTIKKAILYVVLMAYLIGIFGYLSYNIINTLIQFEQETLFIGVYLLAIVALVVIQTIFSGLNLFYFSKDIEHVLPLPTKPIQLLIAKTNVLIITEYFVELIFGIGPLAIYGVLTGAGVAYYIFSFLVLLIIPIVPIILIMIVVMLIMSISNLVKYKERFQLFVNIVIIGLAIGAQFITNSFNNPSEEAVMNAITSANNMVGLIEDYFFTLEPAVDTIISSNTVESILSFGKLFGITAVSVFIYSLVGYKLYLKGVIGTSSTATKKLKNINKYFVKKKIAISYVIKEFKTLYRNPVYLVQCILPSVFMPVVLLASGYSIMQAEGGIGQLSELVITNSLGICIILTVINFLFSMNFISVTAVSRDGNNAIFTKYIPISFYKQFIYKILPNFILNIIPIVLVIVLITLMFNAPVGFSVMLLIMAMLTNCIQSMLMLVVDLKRPKLNWNNEYAVVKQNMNMIFEFALMIFICTIVGIVGFVCKGLNYLVVAAMLSVFFTIAVILVNMYVKKNVNKLFEKII